MKSLILFLALIFTGIVLNAQAKTIQERMGYSKDTKLLIIHADDLGVAHTENEATIAAMEKGSVSSASIMVPTPWFSEIAAYAVTHSRADFGLHLTLTSEWKYYKWGPVGEAVKGLTNKNGFLYSSVDSVYLSAQLPEVEKELRAQIEKAKQFGIDFTHLDSHMGTLFGRPDYLKLLIRLGREYNVPVLLARTAGGSVFNHDLSAFLTDKDVIVEGTFTASPGDFKNGMDQYYTRLINTLKPGLNMFIIHTAYDNIEMQAITVDHPDWGAAWRQADYNFFSGDACKRLLKDQNIKLVTWREVRDKLLRTN